MGKKDDRKIVGNKSAAIVVPGYGNLYNVQLDKQEAEMINRTARQHYDTFDRSKVHLKRLLETFYDPYSTKYTHVEDL